MMTDIGLMQYKREWMGGWVGGGRGYYVLISGVVLIEVVTS